MNPQDISSMASSIMSNGTNSLQADETDAGDSEFACPSCGAQISVMSNPSVPE